MNLSVFDTVRRSFRGLNRWVNKTPYRALEQAYEEILKIKAIEDEHFDGQTIVPGLKDYSENVYQYFRAQANQHLRVAKVRLTEFRTSQNFLRLTNPEAFGFDARTPPDREALDPDGVMLEKLRFVDEAIARYSPYREISKSLVPLDSPNVPPLNPKANALAGGEALTPVPSRNSSRNAQRNSLRSPRSTAMASDNPPPSTPRRTERVASQTSFVPRSILGTFDRLRRDLDPAAEQEVVQDFRLSRAKTALAARFLLILVIVPLLTHHLSKTFVVGPLVERFHAEQPVDAALSPHLEEEALEELGRYREHLEFLVLTHELPRLSPEDLDERMEVKAASLFEEFRGRATDAIKNVFADFLAAIAFAIILLISKPEIAILKSFMDELIYGLSDSAKAFIIILFTDIFVGFHSPHGWEVILEGVARHFGLPESREFIFLFIATFPVILDTVFKYWIFRYLNRISPSAVATYRNMNE